MFSAKTKNNRSSLISDVINTNTLVLDGADTSLGYELDASYNMNVYNDLNIGGTITVNGQIMGNVFSTIGNPAQRSINITQNPTSNQGFQSVAVGFDAGDSNQGASSIAIGALAGQVSQPANSIVINATGSALNGATASACYVSPIRNATTTNVLYYDNTSKEVSYGATSGGSSGGSHGYLYYTNSISQTLVNNTLSALKFDTPSSRNVAITGLSYNSGTGIFTNSSGGTLVLSVSSSVLFNINATGYREVMFSHSTMGTLAFAILPSVGASQATGITTSAIIHLLNGETFKCDVLQTSGASLGTFTTAYSPTSLTIYQL